jgi:hypothetical protein
MSKSVYQKIIINSLETNGRPLTIREIMSLNGIYTTKNTYVISALKRLIEQNKVRVCSSACSSSKTKTLWMDKSITLNPI